MENKHVKAVVGYYSLFPPFDGDYKQSEVTKSLTQSVLTDTRKNNQRIWKI